MVDVDPKEDENVSFLKNLSEKRKRKPCDKPYLEEDPNKLTIRLEKAPALGPFNCMRQCKKHVLIICTTL